MTEVFLVVIDDLPLRDSFVDGEITIQQSGAAFLNLLLCVDLLPHEHGQIAMFECVHGIKDFWMLQ